MQNCLFVVTRYFGGIRLGAGGLVRAYAGSVSQALEEAGLAQKVRVGLYRFACEPGEAGKMLNLLYQQQIFSIADTIYGAQAVFTLRMPDERKAQAERWLTERLQKQTELTQIRFEYEEVPFAER